MELKLKHMKTYIWASSKPMTQRMIKNISSREDFDKLIHLSIACPELMEMGNKFALNRYDQASDYLFQMKKLVRYDSKVILNPEGCPAFLTALGTAISSEIVLFPHVFEDGGVIWQEI